MPASTAIGIERRLLPWARFAVGDQWLVGDAFSGLVQARLARAVPERLVLVDDGAITRRLARLLVAGEPLLRPPRHVGERTPGRVGSRSRPTCTPTTPPCTPSRRSARRCAITASAGRARTGSPRATCRRIGGSCSAPLPSPTATS